MRRVTYDFTALGCDTPKQKCCVCRSDATHRLWYKWYYEPRDADDPCLPVCEKHVRNPKQWERGIERRIG